jgi:hypothetical protein
VHAKSDGTATDMKFCIVQHEFSLSGCTATTEPEVVITMRRNEIEMQFWRQNIGFRGLQIRRNVKRHEVLYSSARILPNLDMTTTKPEVVITMRRCEIEMQFWCLNIGFRARQIQWNIDRHEVLYISARILHIWMHGDHGTGSSYYNASERDRNAISASKYRFSCTPSPTGHRLTRSSV